MQADRAIQSKSVSYLARLTQGRLTRTQNVSAVAQGGMKISQFSVCATTRLDEWWTDSIISFIANQWQARLWIAISQRTIAQHNENKHRVHRQRSPQPSFLRIALNSTADRKRETIAAEKGRKLRLISFINCQHSNIDNWLNKRRRLHQTIS